MREKNDSCQKCRNTKASRSQTPTTSEGAEVVNIFRLHNGKTFLYAFIPVEANLFHSNANVSSTLRCDIRSVIIYCRCCLLDVDIKLILIEKQFNLPKKNPSVLIKSGILAAAAQFHLSSLMFCVREIIHALQRSILYSPLLSPACLWCKVATGNHFSFLRSKKALFY